jgi:hypothetical protein
LAGIFVLFSRMIRRAYIAGILGLGLMTVAGFTTPAYSRFVSSAQSVQHYIKNLTDSGNSLSPIERLVFSIMLSDSKSQDSRDEGTAPERRT